MKVNEIVKKAYQKYIYIEHQGELVEFILNNGKSKVSRSVCNRKIKFTKTSLDDLHIEV